jgi:transposase-like protein
VNLEREPLRGEVEVDDTWIGGTQAGLRGSRQLKGRKAALVIVAVEKRGKASGRVRMAVIPDFKSATLNAFVQQNVAPASTIYTDGSRASSVSNKPASDIFHAHSHCKATFAKARNRWCHSRIGPLAIYNNGSLDPIMA